MKLPRVPALILFLILCVSVSVHPPMHAQSAQSTVPQWQVDAGGKMQFDVTSVKQNKSGAPPSGDRPSSNVDFGGGPGAPNGGFFSATNLTLYNYMIFAFNIDGSQYQQLRPQLPAWALVDRFDIQARAAGDPTKDQMRLMMQSLLADRFKLAIHMETRQLPAFDVVLAKSGKTGPMLRPHSDGPSCDAQSNLGQPAAAKAPEVFPRTCGTIAVLPPSGASGLAHLGARNMGLGSILSSLAGYGNMQRPMIDRTGLTGMFDFSIEWVPQSSGPPSATAETDAPGPTVLEAIQVQLGLKLETRTESVDVFVLDHLEEPSPN